MYLVDLYTVSANLAGIGGIAFPCGFSEAGLPIGLQLQAPPFEEERLLRAAHMFQQATDWHTQRAADCDTSLAIEPMTEPYTTVIGLEVHVQLLTRSEAVLRLQHEVWGAAEHADLPGLHRHAGHAAGDESRGVSSWRLKTALALNCEIAPFTKWDRKQYYYPDLPKDYQISQYDLPLSHDGWLEISDPKGRFEPKQIGIIRAHLEEDAGKSMHDEVAGKADSRIDLNRTGTPLLEIVSQPDMRSPLEAKAYLDGAEAAAHVPGRLGLQHAGRQPAGRREHQSAHRHARRARSPRRSSKSRT